MSTILYILPRLSLIALCITAPLHLISIYYLMMFRQSVRHSVNYYYYGYRAKATLLMSVYGWCIYTIAGVFNPSHVTGSIVIFLGVLNTHTQYRRYKDEDFDDLDPFNKLLKKHMKKLWSSVKSHIPSPSRVAPVPTA